MSHVPGAAQPPSDLSRPGGFVTAIKSLASSRLMKSPPPPRTPSSMFGGNAASFSVQNLATRSDKLSPLHFGSLELLRNGSPNERISAAGTLRYAIKDYPTRPALDIWEAAKDLIDPAKTTAARIAGWELLTECGKHPSSTDLERKVYFETIATPASPQDFHLQMAALVDLTKGGRVLAGFEYDVIPLLATWLSKAYAAVRSARRKAKRNATNKVLVSGEENNLAQLFSLIIDVVKFSFNFADEQSLCELVDSLLDICMNTSAENDLLTSIKVIEAIVTYGNIPCAKLPDCIQVLSTILCKVPELEADAWRTISTLLRSHNSEAIVRILLDVLRTQPADPDLTRDSCNARSSLAVLQRLLSQSPEERYPVVPLVLLIDGISSVVRETSFTSVFAAVLGLMNSLLNFNGTGVLNPILLEEDWSPLLDAAAQCCKRAPIQSAAELEGLDDTRFSTTSVDDYYDKAERDLRREMRKLISRVELMVAKPPSIFVSSTTIIKFLVDLQAALPDSAAEAVLAYFCATHSCCPPNFEWRDNLFLVQDVFLRDKSRSPSVRLKALQTLLEAVELLDIAVEPDDLDLVPNIVRNLLSMTVDETDIAILESIASLMETVASFAGLEFFYEVVDGLMFVIPKDRFSPTPLPSKSPFGPLTLENTTRTGSGNQSPSDVICKCFVKIFLAIVGRDASKATYIFSKLVSIARSGECGVDTRLTAMQLLFRVRADWNHRIFLTSDFSEAEHLAASLYRTSAFVAREQTEDVISSLGRSRGEVQPRFSRGLSLTQPSTPHERSSALLRTSNTSRTPYTPKYNPTWMFLEPDAVLQGMPKTVSPVLLSYSMGDVDEQEYDVCPRPLTGTLNMGSWLETVTHILARGADWEVYSFILVHLHLQLGNPAVFRGATPQIRDIRRLVCELVRQENFPEPPKSTGLRRADVANCLYHTLLMMLNYHEHFQRTEDDEIVSCFVHGLGTWERSTKCCIHALSLCCLEIPLSAGRSLVPMLSKMSTIITQPRVAVHILEFLAGLNRSPKLFVNFREDDFRIVFGICFRYLEYVRDTKQTSRGGQSSEPSTPTVGNDLAPLPGPLQDDLPHYVYALAYHVILYWYMALRLPDRATHVGWIAKNLYADLEGSNAAAEEQALTTMDFIQRVTFADVDEPLEAPLMAPERSEGVALRRWIVGESIITVSQASDKGWAQIVKRQPSSTSSYVVRESISLVSAAWDQPELIDKTGLWNKLLPSHLFVQLVSPMRQPQDGFRPIPLPDDAVVNRAIRVLDLKSTIDGHKVGVIYIGEGQTKEAEILANVSGSCDYVTFLNGLGTLTRLKGSKFNMQGLDREYDTDGKFAFVWRDRIMGVVFHVTTQMPTDLERDPHCGHKKKHIGNDFVNIIFKDSGLPFRFNTFPSEFNLVYIVITPESRSSSSGGHSTHEARQVAGSTGGEAEKNDNGEGCGSDLMPRCGGPFFHVKVMSKPGFPQISSASQAKVVSQKVLPHYVRLLALNASVLSLVWANREGGEHVGNWRGRLHDIRRLRDRYGGSGKAAVGTASAAIPGGMSTPASSGGPLVPVSTLGGRFSSPVASMSSPPSSSGGVPHLAPMSTQPQQAADGGGDGQRSAVRDSFGSLRRTSTATFLTSTSEETSHRSSILSAVTNDTELMQIQGLEPLGDSKNFSKWA